MKGHELAVSCIRFNNFRPRGFLDLWTKYSRMDIFKDCIRVFRDNDYGDNRMSGQRGRAETGERVTLGFSRRYCTSF